MTTTVASVETPGHCLVELEIFEGPLDLLLHLVKKHELPIFDIPISFVTEKYLEYLELLQSLQLDVAGEYLLMAATLAHIKSRELLPTPEADPSEEEGADEPDPRQELIRRLLEYQKYKDAAEQLGGRPVMGRNVFSRGAPVQAVAQGEAPLAEVSVFKLVEALGRMLGRMREQPTHNVVVDRVSLFDRVQTLASRLEREQSFSFEACFAELETRYEMVVTFLAVLELTRLKVVRLHQPEGCQEILISRTPADLQEALKSFGVEEEYRE